MPDSIYRWYNYCHMIIDKIMRKVTDDTVIICFINIMIIVMMYSDRPQHSNQA